MRSRRNKFDREEAVLPSYSSMPRFLTVGCALVLASTGAFAQSGEALRTALVGRSVVVKLAMPSTFRGIDIRMANAARIDSADVSSRREKYGTSLTAGQLVSITDVVVRKDHIEVHLNGGGDGRFTNRSSLPDGPLPTAQGGDRGERNREARMSPAAGATTIRELTRNRSGSRFNIWYPTRVTSELLTPQSVMNALGAYVNFSPPGIRYLTNP